MAKIRRIRSCIRVNPWRLIFTRSHGITPTILHIHTELYLFTRIPQKNKHIHTCRPARENAHIRTCRCTSTCRSARTYAQAHMLAQSCRWHTHMHASSHRHTHAYAQALKFA